VTFTTLDAVAGGVGPAASASASSGCATTATPPYRGPAADLAEVVARREAVSAAVHAAGYRYVTLDLDGFRSGNLNDSLAPDRAPASEESP